jgi:hypothetical protein
MEFINKNPLYIIISLGIIIASCNNEDSPDCFKKAGEDAILIRETGEFNEIKYIEYIETELVQDTLCFVELIGPENLLKKLKTANENGTLLIENENTCAFVRDMSRRPRLRIHVKALQAIYIHDGAGDIFCDGPLQGDSIFVECKHGNGPVNLNLNYRKGVFQFHTGACDLNLSGSVEIAELYNNGYGLMDASALTTERAFLNNSSINDVLVHADEYLYVAIYNSGNVYYKGNVSSVDLSINGSGQLLRME